MDLNKNKILKLVEKRCKEIKLPRKRLKKNKLLLIGYIYGLIDTVSVLKKDSA